MMTFFNILRRQRFTTLPDVSLAFGNTLLYENSPDDISSLAFSLCLVQPTIAAYLLQSYPLLQNVELRILNTAPIAIDLLMKEVTAIASTLKERSAAEERASRVLHGRP